MCPQDSIKEFFRFEEENPTEPIVTEEIEIFFKLFKNCWFSVNPFFEEEGELIKLQIFVI